MSFITTALAHDAVCNSGEEWMFHNLPKDYDDPLEHEDVTVLEEGKDYEMVDSQKHEKAALGMLVLTALLVFGGVIAAISMLIKYA